MHDLKQFNDYIKKLPEHLPNGMSAISLIMKMIMGLFTNRFLFVKGFKDNHISIGTTKGRSRIVVRMDRKSKGNYIIIDDGFNGNLNLTIRGNNSFFYIGKNAVIKKSKLSIVRSASVLAIGEHVGIRAGANIKSYGTTVLGDDAMLSANVLIQEYDGHPIFDVEHNELNHKVNGVFIGKHTWLCRDVKIIKSVKTGTGSIIGAFSTLTKNVPADSIAVGVPAKVIREGGVYWSRNYTKKELSKARSFFQTEHQSEID
ncbi:acyltransferase [Vibrionales bacterium C3R12]|nr:acyltransferase [Vibrionales bacterium C3R12]